MHPTNPLTRFGNYHLLERLGRGGMAEVWKALPACPRLGGPVDPTRPLVIKRILPELMTEAEFLTMFEAEARLSAALHHQNIVQVYESGDVDGDYYLALEYVPGSDLRTFLHALCEKG